MGLITPREYQIEALEAVANHYNLGIKQQLISLPTGCGKTVVFALLAKKLNVKTLVIAHTEELITQAVSKFKVVWPEVDIGIVKAESDDINAQVVVASIQTAARHQRLQRLKEQGFELLIIDEAHHAAAPSYASLVKELGFCNADNNKLLVGVTATPKRGDGIGLKNVFQEIVFERSINTMIRAGYLAPLVGKQIFTKIDLKSVSIRKGDFVAFELSRIVNIPERNQLIVDNYKQYASERKKSLAFCVDVQHAKDLADTFNRNGIPSMAVYGSMSREERFTVLDSFSKSHYKVLTNCHLLTEGFDEPSIDCIIMARPTQSAGLFTQMVGRGTRTFPLKQDCLILDFTDNSNRHDLCTYKNTLDGVVACLFDLEREIMPNEGVALSNSAIVENKPFERLKIIQDKVEDIEFFDNAQFAWTPIGDSWHLKLSTTRDVWVRKAINGFLIVAHKDGEILNLSSRPLPVDYALGVAEDWARKQTTKNAWARKDAQWRSEPASQKQIQALSKLGFTLTNKLSKGDAAQLMDNKLNEPATSKQLYWLRSRGIETKKGMTKFEAKHLIVQNLGLKSSI